MPTPKRPRPKPARKAKPGPPAPRLKIDGTFDELITRSLAAKKPAGGWPKK